MVELAAGPLSRVDADGTPAPCSTAARAGARRAPRRAPRRPDCVARIPFGPERRRQMRCLQPPPLRRRDGPAAGPGGDRRALHGVDARTASAWNTFAANAPDVELGERPGVCAHFLIDRDGTIAQLVPLHFRCRHTIGLNHVAIGIEHVGISDADVDRRSPRLRASLRLTRWLQERFGIATATSSATPRASPARYHHELVARLRERTHGDFAPATMRRYRALRCCPRPRRGWP